ncbi:MAG TPA: hypothetical protein VFV23_06990 [Verrucomicrobiae bacterium]|nr:hypothetical protein [Verrucomicrobiae bacterium]
MRRIYWIVFGLCLCVLPLPAETLQLADGNSLTGDIINFNDNGMTLRTPAETYTNVFWTKLSQETLKQLAKNPKMTAMVEPFIETPPATRAKKAEIQVHDVNRIKNPPAQSIIGAMFSSSVGIILILLIYAANIYAGFEVAIFRARPIGMVMGISAVLPVLGPILFLSMPTYVPPAPVDETVPMEPQQFIVPGQAPAAGEAHATAAQWQAASETSSQAGAQVAEQPKAPPQVFQRGQFTFNKRFFETKFSGYFGMARTGEAKNFDLFVRTAAGMFQVNRVTRITANDVHLETMQGGTVREIMAPFADIQEIQLRPK